MGPNRRMCHGLQISVKVHDRYQRWVSTLSPADPRIIVQAAASSQNLSSAMWLLHPHIVWAIDECSFEAPIVFAHPKFKHSSGRCVHIDLAGVRRTGLDHCHGHVGFSASRPARGVPAVPPPTTMKSISCDMLGSWKRELY